MRKLLGPIKTHRNMNEKKNGDIQIYEYNYKHDEKRTV